MLLNLHIKNFALIDRVDMNFTRGLNILTGETGAGKSILIDSVNFVLGDKQNKDIIRKGQETAYVEAVFECDRPEITVLLEDNGIAMDDLLIISREINSNGRSISRINGRTVTIALLKQIGTLLVDLHGQHEHQSLLYENGHLDILDSFCDANFSRVKREYQELYLKSKELDKRLEELTRDEQFKLRRMDLLTYQLREIEDAKLKEGEDTELSKRRLILANSERIFSNLKLAYERLYENPEGEGAYDCLGKGVSSIENLISFDEKLSIMHRELLDIYYRLGDVTSGIREYLDHIEFDPKELDEIESRLDIINKLKKKYGSSIGEIITYYNRSLEELEQIQKSDELINRYSREKEDSLRLLNNLAKEMSVTRKNVADVLCKKIEGELAYLGMDKAIFEVQINDREQLNENGRDEVRFMMTANPGEPLRQLSKVASGGEMSRIMLAIKSVIADIDRIPTLIFDEIDIGISGRTAQAVAEKMWQISSKHQILSVTHLPQIASMADNHFKIQKNVEMEITTTTVHKLDSLKQIDELARMLSGSVITELTRNHAKEVLELADIKKKEIIEHAM